MNALIKTFIPGALCLLTLPLFFPAALQAQEEKKADLPAGPLLQKAKEPMKWTIQFTYPPPPAPVTAPDAPKDAPPAPLPYSSDTPRKITVTMSNQLIWEQTVKLNGSVVDRWQTGKTQYMKSGSSTWTQHEPGAHGSASDSGYNPLPEGGFRDLDWISETSYSGTALFENVNCLVFIGGVATPLADKPDKQKLQIETAPVILLVDAQTRLPFYHRINGEIRRYEFSASPPAVLSFPGDLTAAIKEGEKARARLLQPASRPY
jgi:hypothetical protein